MLMLIGELHQNHIHLRRKYTCTQLLKEVPKPCGVSPIANAPFNDDLRKAQLLGIKMLHLLRCLQPEQVAPFTSEQRLIRRVPIREPS